jgi:regulatory associated protein of mTOR
MLLFEKKCQGSLDLQQEERILFHYNGHGVPKPTAGGELWVFNKTYTQYIPISVYDLQTWLGSPCIYVYDCSNAGNILNAFNKFAQQRDTESARQNQQATHIPKESQSPNGIAPLPYVPLSHSIQIAACQANQVLPMSPDLPADLLTCCLTTPIEIALRWIVLHDPLIKNVTPEMILKIPGKLNDRRTPLGELNWIFTAITDTIAWNVLSPEMFQRLFRQDLMVAALFRNFLLADRIMRNYKCNPMSSPALPPTHQHPMWDAWDLAADFCLAQLPALLKSTASHPVEYKHSTFFTEQLSAFEVWLKKGNICNRPPQQLPIVLQVLLSQVHRLRALMLLSKFLDLGQNAVNLSLSVGIFPYVLKLLQSPASELRPVLVFIWAKLLAVDSSCQADLLKDNGYTYFIGILSMPDGNMGIIANPSEHRAMCAFVLSVFCRNFPGGQHACLKNGLLAAVIPHLKDEDSLLRQWSCVCLTQFWTGFPEAKWAALSGGVDDIVATLLQDPVAEVRAAAVAALGALLGDLQKNDINGFNSEQSIITQILKSLTDASPVVRRELVVAFSRSVYDHQTKYVMTAVELIEEERVHTTSTLDERKLAKGTSIVDRLKVAEAFNKPIQKSIYNIVWKAILSLSVDPHPAVSELGVQIVDKIMARVLTSGNYDHASLLITRTEGSAASSASNHALNIGDMQRARNPSLTGMTVLRPVSSPTLKRSGSFVSSIQRFFVGIPHIGSQETMSPVSYQTPISSGLRKMRPSSMVNISSLNLHPGTQMEHRSSLPSAAIQPIDPDSILLKSDFYQWSCEYFREPQMAVLDSDNRSPRLTTLGVSSTMNDNGGNSGEIRCW